MDTLKILTPTEINDKQTLANETGPSTEMEWTQTPMPTQEQLNLDVEIDKERRLALKRQNQPPAGQTSGWNRVKSKKMRITPRDSNEKHFPYWNIRIPLELANVSKECLTFYEKYLEFVAFRMHVNCKRPFIIDNERGTFKDFNNKYPNFYFKHDCGNRCSMYMTAYFREIRSRYYALPIEQQIGYKEVNFLGDIRLKPEMNPNKGDAIMPSLFQVTSQNWNQRLGVGFTYATSDMIENFLLNYAYKVAQYGSYEEAARHYVVDSMVLIRESQGFRLVPTRSSDIQLYSDSKATAFLESIIHGGIHPRVIPSLAQMYKNLSITLKKEEAIELQELCRKAWGLITKGNGWSLHCSYKHILAKLPLRNAYHFFA